MTVQEELFKAMDDMIMHRIDVVTDSPWFREKMDEVMDARIDSQIAQIVKDILKEERNA